jgi:glutamyl-Q tRNA(Asp) synthetase
VSAVASYADARQHFGQWILRIDDIDQPRTKSGAAESIIHTLSAFGFKWNHSIQWQSERISQYEQVIQELKDRNAVYFCTCSRREITKIAATGADGMIYPGTCRDQRHSENARHAIRIRTNSEKIYFSDRVFGHFEQNLETLSGDFIIRRADKITAYQLAVVVDDYLDQVSHVVRGADLLMSTCKQIYLGGLLGYPTLDFAHTPLVINKSGKKLSKSDRAFPVNPDTPVTALIAAWRFLGQQDITPRVQTVEEFWDEATTTWSIQKVPAGYP